MVIATGHSHHIIITDFFSIAISFAQFDDLLFRISPRTEKINKNKNNKKTNVKFRRRTIRTMSSEFCLIVVDGASSSVLL